MRVRLTFSSDAPVMLSIWYNRALQGMIYGALGEDYGRWLHDSGFIQGRRHLKLFTFSRPLGTYRRRGDYMEFHGPVSIIVSSPVEEFMERLCAGFVERGGAELEVNRLRLESLEVLARPEVGSELEVHTLSPITVYSTLRAADGRKKTYYYSPFEREFSELISANLSRKASVLGIGIGAGAGVEARPAGRVREVVSIFKGTVVKGWIGAFRLRGDPTLLGLGYDSGLGAKNSAGFGMVELSTGGVRDGVPEAERRDARHGDPDLVLGGVRPGGLVHQQGHNAGPR
ncbi:MAG: CRISPR-associated endoribonuclease Cas6, partial [Conexivisphaera sp.]